MAWDGAYSSWQYSRWVWNIARNMRITEPTGAELAAVKTFIKLFWNPAAQTGTRSWLQAEFQEKAVNAGDNYECDIDTEPTNVLVEILEVIGRNLKQIPLTDAEAGYANTLIAATGNRRYGTGAYYGGAAGSLIS
jgi:hypothetical protein